MYSLLPKSIRTSAFTLFALFVIGFWIAVERLGMPMNPFRAASSIAGGLVLLAIFFFRSHEYRSPWRWLWRRFPKLNDWIFPDINGIWVGETQSNWTVLRALAGAAKSGEVLEPEALSGIPLLTGKMAMQVSASLFKIDIRSISGNGGRVRSISAKAIRDSDTKDFSIHYIFQAEMPSPSHSDEGIHVGAVTLRFTAPNWQLTKGEYWTRRRWREGMNTAGLIALVRANDDGGGGVPGLELQLASFPTGLPKYTPGEVQE